MFKIGEFSKLSSITIKMLRNYDEMGLLVPKRIDQSSNYRYYAADQLEDAAKINLYKKLGFPLSTIKTLLNDTDNEFSVIEHLRQKEAELSHSLDEIKLQVKLIQDLKEKSSRTWLEKYQVIPKELTSKTVVSITRTIDNYNDEMPLWIDLYSLIDKHKLSTVPNGFVATLYHDPEYKDNDMKIEVMVECYSNGVITKTLESSMVASVLFSGSYDQMPDISRAIAYWAEENNQVLTGKMMNIYHRVAENDSANLTEACYMLERKQ